MSTKALSDIDFGGATRGVNHPDPVSAQDVATKAYVDRNDGVTNAQLANMADATIKGRAVGAGTGDPTDLTGLQLGQLLRLDTRVDDVSTSGSGVPYSVAATTNWVRFTALTGPYTLEGCDANSAGKIIIWHVEPGVTGTLVLNHNSGAVTNALRFFCPGGANLTLSSGDTAVTTYTSNRHRVISVARAGFALTDGDKGDITVGSNATVWTIDNDVVSNAKAANMADATIKGRGIGAGTGDPTDLTGSQVGQILRLGSFEDVALVQASSPYNDYGVNQATKVIRIFVAGGETVTITGCALGSSNSGGYFTVFKWGSGTLVFAHANGGSATGNQMQLPYGRDLILQDREGVDFQFVGGRWQATTKTAIGRVRKNSTGTEFVRGRLNLIEGPGIKLDIADDSANDEVDVTVSASVPQGPMGPAGDQGPQGDPGDVGPQGATGPAGSRVFAITSTEPERLGSGAPIVVLQFPIAANTLRVGSMYAITVHYEHVRVTTNALSCQFGTDATMAYADYSTVATGTARGHFKGTALCLALGSSRTIRLMIEAYDQDGNRHASVKRDLDTTAEILLEARIQQPLPGASDRLTVTQAWAEQIN